MAAQKSRVVWWLFALLLVLPITIAKTVSYSFMITEVLTDFHNPNHALQTAADLANVATTKVAQLVNGQYPGPTIVATEGDTIEVMVTNMLESRALTIHWHGVRQYQTPWMDGTSTITQCAFAPHTTFTYRFLADPAGTRWWHAHNGEQYEYGVAGPLIIHPVQDSHPLASLYSDELIMSLTDWWPDPSSAFLTPGLNYENTPLALINGQWGNGSTSYPYPIINVVDKTCYRLRAISMISQISGFKVSIAGHNLTVLAVDGVDVQPFETGSFSLFAAERVDVILCADQPSGQYLIQVSTLAVRGIGPFTYYAYLRYASVTDSVPTDLMGSGGGRSPAATSSMTYDSITSLQLLQTLDLSNTMRRDSKATNEVTYTLPLGIRLGGSWYASPSHTPFEHPTIPLLQSLGQCGTFPGTEMIIVSQNTSLVTLILNNLSDNVHPMHLHGHTLTILGTGYNASWTSLNIFTQYANAPCWNDSFPNAAPVQSDTRLTGVAKDRFWGCPFVVGRDADKLTYEIIKDVVVVPSHTWAVVQFTPNNPGFWLMHCHVQHHHLRGMAIVFGALVDQIPPAPSLALACGLSCPVTTATPTLQLSLENQVSLLPAVFVCVGLIVAAIFMVVLVRYLEQRTHFVFV